MKFLTQYVLKILGFSPRQQWIYCNFSALNFFTQTECTRISYSYSIESTEILTHMSGSRVGSSSCGSCNSRSESVRSEHTHSLMMLRSPLVSLVSYPAIVLPFISSLLLWEEIYHLAISASAYFHSFRPIERKMWILMLMQYKLTTCPICLLWACGHNQMITAMQVTISYTWSRSFSCFDVFARMSWYPTVSLSGKRLALLDEYTPCEISFLVYQKPKLLPAALFF